MPVGALSAGASGKKSVCVEYLISDRRFATEEKCDLEPSVILLLVLAACMHSTWNLAAKKSLDKQVFLWLSLVLSSIIYLVPFVFVYRPLTRVGWLFVMASGAVEAIYYMILGSAYQRGDLSLVYPVARGSAPLFVTLSAFLFLGERISALGVAGILLTVVGVYVLHLKSLSRSGLLGPMAAMKESGSRLALYTGVAIAGYSVIDKVGVRHVHPAPYIYLVFLVSVAILAPYMWLVKKPQIVLEWQRNKASLAFVAVANVATYLVVLYAMTLSKVSYVSSVREISVVFGALVGTAVLGEPFGSTKIAGALLVFAGVLMISFAR